MVKKSLKSRTIVFAIALEVLGVIQLNADFLSTLLTPAQFGWVMLIIGIIVKVLRIWTTTPLFTK